MQRWRLMRRTTIIKLEENLVKCLVQLSCQLPWFARSELIIGRKPSGVLRNPGLTHLKKLSKLNQILF